MLGRYIRMKANEFVFRERVEQGIDIIQVFKWQVRQILVASGAPRLLGINKGRHDRTAKVIPVHTKLYTSGRKILGNSAVN